MVVACLLLTAQVEADVVSLNPSHDNTMYSENGDLSNGAGEFIFSGRTALSGLRRALLAFDVAALSARSTIASAT